MSIDRLQDRIRKLKNPSVVDFFALQEQVPAHILTQEGSFIQAYGRFCTELLLALKDTVPAARFSFDSFALLGAQGLALLSDMTKTAKQAGFYVLLDGAEVYSAQAAHAAADRLFDRQCPWQFDALVVSSYIGSDGLKPYAQKLSGGEKALFVVIRTSNKSAAELQDLLTGSRLAYMAKADLVNRLGLPLQGKCGYSQIGGMGAAASADSLHSLRSKYKNMFLLVDGYDSPNGNAKNCSFAFDRFGHGAAVCAGFSITGAWLEADNDGQGYTEDAVLAAERMKKNLLRYITVL